MARLRGGRWVSEAKTLAQGATASAEPDPDREAYVAESRPFAVITGASSGIGRELARQFVTNDFDVLIAAEDSELAAAADDLTGPGTNVQAVRADLATPGGAEELVAAITATGRAVLDALALNAGVGNGGAFADVPLADEQHLIAVNIGSTVDLAKRIVPGMVRRGAGRVLFTSSVASQLPGPYYATYAASKAFIQSFAHALRGYQAQGHRRQRHRLAARADRHRVLRPGRHGRYPGRFIR